jgi:hypothetical protein
MHNNIDEITRKIAEKSRDLADIFASIARSLSEANGEYENRFDEKEPKKNKSNYPKNARPIIKGSIKGMPINTYPDGIPGLCYPICVCQAIGKWNSFKNGFKGVAKYLNNDYFLSCGKINKSILIFTCAWDEIDFNELFREKFNEYTNQGKTICIVLLTSNGITLQYLK